MGTTILAVFLSIFFLLLSIVNFRKEGQEKITNRLMAYTEKDKKEKASAKKKKKPFLGRKESEEELLTVDKDDWKIKIKNQLSQADIPLRAEEFIFLCFLGGLLTGLIFTYFTSVAILFLPGFVAGSLIIPILIIRRAKVKRTVNFNQQLSGALSTMANSLRVGFSLFQAMKSLSEEMPSPLSVEFRRTLQEINLGTQTDRALQNMCDRIKSEDLELVVMAIIIQRQVGGNLSEVLDNIAHTIMERIKVQREVRTLTAQGRISGIIIGLLPLFLAAAIYLINPEYIISFFTNPLGYFLIGLGFCSQLIGIMFIRKIVNIDW